MVIGVVFNSGPQPGASLRAVLRLSIIVNFEDLPFHRSPTAPLPYHIAPVLANPVTDFGRTIRIVIVNEDKAVEAPVECLPPVGTDLPMPAVSRQPKTLRPQNRGLLDDWRT